MGGFKVVSEGTDVGVACGNEGDRGEDKEN